MRAEARSEGAPEGALEHARAVLGRTLVTRGSRLVAERGATIGACRDLAALDRWLARALMANSAEEVFRRG